MRANFPKHVPVRMREKHSRLIAARRITDRSIKNFYIPRKTRPHVSSQKTYSRSSTTLISSASVLEGLDPERDSCEKVENLRVADLRRSGRLDERLGGLDHLVLGEV